MIEHGWSEVPSISMTKGWHDTCKCGQHTGYHQTSKEMREARARHLRDVAERKIWYVVESGALLHTTDTKRRALAMVRATAGRKVAAGTYLTESGHLITTDPSNITQAQGEKP